MRRTQEWDNATLHLSVEKETVVVCAAPIENQQNKAARVGVFSPLLDLREEISTEPPLKIFPTYNRFQNDRPGADQNELNPYQKVDPTGLSF
jgi:hypothetical protein